VAKKVEEKETAKVEKVEAKPEKPPVVRIGLSDFAVVVGQKDATLFAGFAFEEKLAGRLRDTEDAYAERFEKFKTREVK